MIAPGAAADKHPIWGNLGAVTGSPKRAAAKAPRRGCQKSGAGCKNACNEGCADQAVLAIQYAAKHFASTDPHITLRDLERGRWVGGVADSHSRMRIETECAPCEGTDADVLCGATFAVDADGNKTRTNSVYATTVGAWMAMLGGGCKREITCSDYSPSCGIGTDGQSYEPANPFTACDEFYGPNCHEKFNSWVFVPSTTLGVSRTGACYATWLCQKNVTSGDGEPELVTCGVTPPVPTGYAPDVQVLTWPITETCGGVQRREDDLKPKINDHGIDSETAPHFDAPTTYTDAPTTTDCIAENLLMGLLVSDGWCTGRTLEGGDWVWRCDPSSFDVAHPGLELGCKWEFHVRMTDCWQRLFWCCPAAPCVEVFI